MCKLLRRYRAARTVLRSSIAIVIGPTPPGTGVSRPARARDGRVDVADEPAVGAVDADVDDRRALASPCRRVTMPGDADRGDEHVGARASRAARSRVREWQIVTVACRCRRSSATGLPTMSLRPITTAFAPSSSTPYSSSSASTPSGVPGTCAGVPARSRPALTGWKPSTSLTGSTARITRPSSMLAGQRQLDEDAVDRVVGVQLGDERRAARPRSSSSGRRRSRASIPTSSVALCFMPDVDVGGRIVADEHRREADRPRERGHLARRPRRGSARRAPSRPSASRSRAPE